MWEGCKRILVYVVVDIVAARRWRLEMASRCTSAAARAFGPQAPFFAFFSRLALQGVLGVE